MGFNVIQPSSSCVHFEYELILFENSMSPYLENAFAAWDNPTRYVPTLWLFKLSISRAGGYGYGSKKRSKMGGSLSFDLQNGLCLWAEFRTLFVIHVYTARKE